jgi:ribose transport system permease protein
MTNSTNPQQVAKSASAKKMLMSDLMQTVGILPILILIVAVFGVIAPNFFTESNLLNITRQASINIVLAAGMTFIILTGGIDLSVGSILGTTAVAAMVVSLIPEFAMLSIPAALMLGMVLGYSTARWWPLPGYRRLSSRSAPTRPCAARLSAGRRYNGDQLEHQL